MGQSGSGKTTLLNILSCRQKIPTNSQYTKEVLVNNIPLNSNNFGKIAAYVMQDDILLSTMTPFESLTFAANLRLNCSKEERKARVNLLISDLMLKKCANRTIGSIIDGGISGGEKKRTAIGVEMITDPQIIFLDEPTSGLDSFTAYSLIKVIKRLCLNQNKTVISTIHLPSSDIFNMFDRLILLIKGKEIYQGNSKLIYEYAEKIGKPIPLYTNPSDHMMKIMYRSEPPEIEQEEFHNNLINLYQNSQLNEVKELIGSNTCDTLNFNDLKLLRGSHFLKSFKYLLYRCAINLMRNVFYTYVRIIVYIYLSILIIMVYYNQTEITLKGIKNKTGAIFFTLISTFVTSMQFVILTFPEERELFLREQSNKMYGVFSYFISKSIMEIPLLIFIPLLVTLIVYWAVGFRNDFEAFFNIFGCLSILMFTSNSLGLTLGCIFPNFRIVIYVTAIVIIPIIMFCGYLSNVETIISWLQWVQYLSPMRYSLEIIFTKEFVKSDFSYNNTYLQPQYPLEQYNYNVGTTICWIGLVSIGIFVRILGLIFLKIRAYIHTNQE